MSNGARGVQTDFRHLGAAGTADSEYNGNALEEARAAADAASLLRCAKEWVVAALEQSEHGGAAIERKGVLEPTATWLEHGGRMTRGGRNGTGKKRRKKRGRGEKRRARPKGMKRQSIVTGAEVDRDSESCEFGKARAGWKS